jgi:hypothetical protein
LSERACCNSGAARCGQATPHGGAPRFFCESCGLNPFHRQSVTPICFGTKVWRFETFDPAGISVQATVQAGMP